MSGKPITPTKARAIKILSAACLQRGIDVEKSDPDYLGRVIWLIHNSAFASAKLLDETVTSAIEKGIKSNRLIQLLATVTTEEQFLAAENERLKRWVNDLQSGMYVNCVYCGHRYGPQDEVPASMADVLTQHIAHCEKHPMNALRSAIEKIYVRIREWERTDADSMDDQEQLDSAEEMISEITLIAAKALEAA